MWQDISQSGPLFQILVINLSPVCLKNRYYLDTLFITETHDIIYTKSAKL